MTVLFTLGNVPITTLGLLLGLSGTIGLLWIAWGSNTPEFHLNAGLWCLLGVIGGGRLGFMFFQGAYFAAHPLEILQIYQGGFSWAGALLGGVLAAALFSWLKAYPWVALADDLLPLFISLSLSLWLSAWLTGWAYGPARQSWWALPAWDEWGNLIQRVPTQLLGILLNLLWYAALEWQQTRLQKAGQQAALALSGFSLIYFSLTYLRADPMQIWAGLRLDAWAALGFALLGLFGFIISTQYHLAPAETSPDTI